MMTIQQITKDMRAAMEKGIESTRREFTSIRSGKATPNMLDTVRVDMYGTSMALNQVASVSAFFPCYNDAPTIETMVRAASEALAEWVDDYEVIVVDDGSTDGTAGAVSSFGEAVTYLRHERRGVSVTRNRGAAHARHREDDPKVRTENEICNTSGITSGISFDGVCSPTILLSALPCNGPSRWPSTRGRSSGTT